MTPSFNETLMSNAGLGLEGPAHVLQFSSKVEAVEFSPFPWSHDLVCIAFPGKLTVGIVKFQEEYEGQLRPIEFENVQNFDTGKDRVHVISWGPETCLKSSPKCISLAFSQSNFKIYTISSNTTNAYTLKEIFEHENYVNDVAYCPKGELLASVSDDLTCRVWSCGESETESKCKFYLRSPGVSVKWNKDDPGKLLVGEKSGTVTFYNVFSQTAFISLRCQFSSLLCLDWSATNRLFVSAVAGGHLVIWNTTSPSTPIYERPIHIDGAAKVKFFPQSELVILTLGATDNTLKVSSLTKPIPQTLATKKFITGLTCHQYLPYVCSGVDSSIHMWRISSV